MRHARRCHASRPRAPSSLIEGRWDSSGAANDFFPCVSWPSHALLASIRLSTRLSSHADASLISASRRSIAATVGSLDAGAAAVSRTLAEPDQITLQRLDRAARHRPFATSQRIVCEFCEQPSADLLEGARLLGPANLGARRDRAEGPFGRRGVAMVLMTRRAGRGPAPPGRRPPPSSRGSWPRPAGSGRCRDLRLWASPPGPCDLPRTTRFHCRIRMLDRVQQAQTASVKPAKGDRQWMAALIPGAVLSCG